MNPIVESIKNITNKTNQSILSRGINPLEDSRFGQIFMQQFMISNPSSYLEA